MAASTYNSKKDTWLTWIILGSVCACLAACVTFLASGPPIELLFAGPLLAFGVILPIWILRSTYYVLSDEQLFAKCGPFKWTIPLAKIESVRRTRSILSGPALSYDRVQIRFGRFRSVLISPERRDQFLVELENRRSLHARGVHRQ